MTTPAKTRLATALREVAAKARPANAAIYEALAHMWDTTKEAEEWARSQTDPQIIAMMAAMGIGPDRSKDQ